MTNPEETTKNAESQSDDPGRSSRRTFLKGAGASAIGTALLGSGSLAGAEVLTGETAHAASARGIQESDSAHFGRMFGNLPPFNRGMNGETLAAALLDIGKPGGV